MSTVKQLLKFKQGPNIHTVPRDASVAEAINKMNSHRIGALLVMGHDRRHIGIITERDILRHVVGSEFDLYETPVYRWMTRKVVCCTVDTSLQDVEALMSRHHIRHLPVMDEGGHCIGLISMQDLNRYQAHDRELTIRYLEDYLMLPVR